MSAHLAIAATAVLAAASWVNRGGSMATGLRGAIELPPPRPPGPDVKPRSKASWIKGKEWARLTASQFPLQWEPGMGWYIIADSDRQVLKDQTVKQPSLEQVKAYLRSGALTHHVRPHAINRLQGIDEDAREKLRGKLSPEDKAFWSGALAYTEEVTDWLDSAEDPGDLRLLMEDVEEVLVKAWLKDKARNL